MYKYMYRVVRRWHNGEEWDREPVYTNKATLKDARDLISRSNNNSMLSPEKYQVRPG